MKQRLLKALSLAAIALCSVSTAWADRVAPTLPPAVEPQNEQCYWIYCPEAEKFVGTNSSSSYAILTNQGDDIYVVQSNGHWNFRKNSLSGYFLYDSNYSDGALHWSSSSYNADYNLTKSGSSYTIQRVGKTTYVGYNASNNYLNVKSETATTWQFMAADKATHYAAEKALYDALVATDGHGWIRDQYEQMYNNRATSTTLELNQAAEELNHALTLSSVSGVFDAQNEYENVLFSSESGWEVNNNRFHLSGWYTGPVSKSIVATFEISENADLSYHVDLNNQYQKVNIYVDGSLVRTIDYWDECNSDNTRLWFEALTPGRHTVKWTVEDNGTNNRSVNFYLYKIGIINTPLITVSCPLPGSLGTEILYNVNSVKDVRNLKVIGDLNDEDMTRLMMLSNAHYIDLSEATCTANVPKEAFRCTSLPYLHHFIFAEGITELDERALYDSNVETITLPSTLKKIGYQAMNGTNVKSLYIPDNVTEIGTYAFAYSRSLTDVHYSTSMTYIPSYAFEHSFHLNTINIPEGITSIDSYAFEYCHSGGFCPELPQSLKTIGSSAFYECNAIKTLVIPDAVDYIGNNAFEACHSLEEITMPMNIYRLSNYSGYSYSILYGCNKLKKITLNSPTLVIAQSDNYKYSITNDEYRPNITLCVPEYLVVPYKLDSYWYNFGDIVGFPSEHIKDYTLHTDLYLDGHSRINGDPNLTIENGALRIEGDAPMGITNFQTTTAFYNYYHNNKFSSLSQVRSGCENITIKGDYTHWMKLYGSRWAFVSLPFDCKVSDITDLTEGRLHAVRYYDGAERAATGTGSSWKKFASEDAIIPAGQGFIIQVDGNYYDAPAWIQFKSQNNASKQYIFSKKEFSKALQKNPSTVESNQGWNLVGNPYQCYYNIHNLNFTAPITVWNGENRTYNAYSIIDDDYALRPNEAFFVQCPSAFDAITFPVGGKQFDATILTQNASQRRAAATSSRKMLNLTLSNDEATDQTRIVINDEASLGYETTCDASKFMSMDNTVAQLYTLDDQGTQYAINERPYDDGFVQLGASFATDGTYTIALTRGDMDSVFLTDLETGETTDLTLCEYTFHAAAGTDNGRFLLSFAGEGTLTAIEALTNSSAAEYYTIDGRHMGNSRDALRKGVYVVRNGNRSAKILVD